jgi:hypothetical protein
VVFAGGTVALMLPFLRLVTPGTLENLPDSGGD